ncbi:hypothetical protein R3P38DRAFT_3288148 [Favolaschia claudopus]|uniref:Uncharacterized protein n=1 Tax=Favolaschia claudopus TaxID=2862362 RepID=A0AAV9ZWZ0_9AGAR
MSPHPYLDPPAPPAKQFATAHTVQTTSLASSKAEPCASASSSYPTSSSLRYHRYHQLHPATPQLPPLVVPSPNHITPHTRASVARHPTCPATISPLSTSLASVSTLKPCPPHRRPRTRSSASPPPPARPTPIPIPISSPPRPPAAAASPSTLKSASRGRRSIASSLEVVEMQGRGRPCFVCILYPPSSFDDPYTPLPPPKPPDIHIDYRAPVVFDVAAVGAERFATPAPTSTSTSRAIYPIPIYPPRSHQFPSSSSRNLSLITLAFLSFTLPISMSHCLEGLFALTAHIFLHTMFDAFTTVEFETFKSGTLATEDFSLLSTANDTESEGVPADFEHQQGGQTFYCVIS